MNTSHQQALVVATHGRHVWVETTSGERIRCHPRGKKNLAVVGDWIRWEPSGDEGLICAIEPRKNLFYRQDEVRTKSFAANIDQILIMLAAEPEFSEVQLTKALIAAQASGINATIILNKQDLGVIFDAAWDRLRPYRAMGYANVPLCLMPSTAGYRSDLPTLDTLMHGKSTLILGPSGTGKSTLINHMIPSAQAATNTISYALNTGKHTTTHTQLYWLDRHTKSALIDSPGFQEFGLHHINPAQLASFMPDFNRFIDGCKFHNCSHTHEPGCHVRMHVDHADPELCISGTRYRIYCSLSQELRQAKF